MNFKLMRIHACRLFRVITFGGVVLASIVATFIGVSFLQAYLPINPVHAHCADFRVYFEGPKSKRFNELFIKKIEDWGQPYFIWKGVVYTTQYGSGDENMDKFIERHIRPEWFSDSPTFDTPEQKAIVEAFKNSSETQHLSWEWCRVIEAAIAKDGIDADARRKHPDIWPPQRWPIPDSK